MLDAVPCDDGCYVAALGMRMVREYVIMGLVAGVGRRFPRLLFLSKEGVIRMSITEFINVMNFCIAIFALGYTIGQNHKK